jgi:predicted RNase H-like nuclease (RuvC/YqgF family)
MESETTVELIGHLVWPGTILFVAWLFQEPIEKVISNIESLKVGDITVAIKQLSDKVDKVEEATKNLTADIYNATGDAFKIREEIWGYIAEILDNASPNTQYEMRKALNEYHLKNQHQNVAELKEMLSNLTDYPEPKGEGGKYSDEITNEYIDAIYDFQERSNFTYSDGVLGPKTLTRMRKELRKP